MKVGLPQEPFWHVSPLVQASPSLQAAPFVLAGLEQVPVAGSQVPATWHWSEAVQTTGLLPVQSPLWQVSVWVQALLSLHAVPLLAFGLEHWPVAVLQVPATWHWSSALQTTGFEPVQVPFWQVSVWVQALPSVQAVPFGWRLSGGQVALLPVQVSAASHWFAAARHTVPADMNVQFSAQHEPAVPFNAPSSHCSEPSTTPLPHVT